MRISCVTDSAAFLPRKKSEPKHETTAFKRVLLLPRRSFPSRAFITQVSQASIYATKRHSHRAFLYDNSIMRRAFPFRRRRANPSEAAKTLSAELADLDFLDDISGDEDDAATLSTQQAASITEASSPTTHQHQQRHHFRDLVESTAIDMRKNASTKRGRRRNAVLFFVTSKEAFRTEIGADYTQALFDDREVCVAGGDDDGLAVHLHAAGHLIREYLAVQELLKEMGDWLPADFEREGGRRRTSPRDFAFGLIETHILSHLAILYTHANLDEVRTPGEAAQIVCWIDSLLMLMKTQCPNTTVSKQWQTDLDRMWDHYLNIGVRKLLRDLFHRSVNLQQHPPDDGEDDYDGIRQNAAGELVTGHPEQIAFLVDSQLAAARDHLPGSESSYGYVEAILVACNEEISTMVSEMMIWVGANWRTLGTPRFCSVINDASRLSETIEERNDEILTSPENQELGDSVRDLAELGLHATKLLCERILFDLQEPEAILSSVGSRAWAEDDKGRVILSTIATFRDYFNDLQVWLPSDYYFPKILKHCFDLTLQTYVESFYSNTMATGIRDAAVVAENLSQDYLNLVIFFNGTVFEKYAGKAGSLSATEVNARLQIIQSMSRLVNPVIGPSDLEEDAKKVLSHTKQHEEHNPAAVLHLAGIRGERHHRNRSVEWVGMLAHAERALKDAATQVQPECILKIPDLRNSRHLRNVRTRTHDLHRRISVQSLQSAEAMKDLIQTTAPQTKIRNFLVNRRKGLRLPPR